MAGIKTPLGLRPTGLDPKVLSTKRTKCLHKPGNTSLRSGALGVGDLAAEECREKEHGPTWALSLAVASATKHRSPDKSKTWPDL